MTRLGAAARGLGRFVYEFVVGDTPELAVGVAVVIPASWLLSRASPEAAVALLPLAVLGLALVSAWRGRRRPAPKAPGR
ncbi:MAG: hypothetical protein ACREN4_03055 [Candidatus Dormibacteria bacterium]